MVAMLAEARDDFPLVLSQGMDGRAGLHLQNHLLSRPSYLHHGMRLCCKKSPPVGGHCTQATCLPMLCDWRIILPAQILPITLQSLRTQLTLDKAKRGIDGSVKIGCTHGFDIRVRQL